MNKKITTVLTIILILIIISIAYVYSSKKIDNNDVGETIEQSTIQEKSEIEKAFEDRNGEELESLPILMYHFFYDEEAGETGQDSNWMEISDFEDQMKYLSENNYYYPSWDEVYEFVKGTKELPIRSIVITIDDGDTTFFELAVPILKKYNVKATSFVVTSWTGEYTINEYKSDILNFESHSNDMHKPGRDGKGAFITMTKEEAYNDLETSKNILKSSKAFCYPFGHYNEFTKQMLTDMEYKLAVTTKSGRVTPEMEPLELPRVRMSGGDSLEGFINRVK